MKDDFKIYLRLLGHARPYWRIMVVAVVGMIFSAALEPVLPALMQPLIDKSLIQKNAASMWQIPLFIVFAFVLKGIADYVSSVASQAVAQKTIADLRALVFAHQLDLPLPRHQREEGGRMLSRVTYDTSLVGEAVSSAWVTILRDSLVLIGLLAFLFYTAWQLTLLVILIAPALALAIRLINRRIRTSSENVQTWMGRVTGLVQEGLSGLREIKIFAAHQEQGQRFHESNQALRKEQMRVIRIQALNVPLVQVLAACSVAAVIFVSSSLSKADLLTPGEFVAFITGMSMVFEPVRRLTNVNAVLQRGLVAAKGIFSLLDEVGEHGHAVGRPNPSAKAPKQSITVSPAAIITRKPPEICFKEVTFRYENSQSDAIKSFSASIPAGRSVMLAGASGVGKSTLLYLLCGYERPTKGEIFLDNMPIININLRELRKKISLVGQTTMLFDLSIRDNLKMVNPTATDQEIWDALARANAFDFVKKLPEKLSTRIGVLGDTLSGGQKQRLSVARSFLKNSPVLLLDEPTSALDEESEAELLGALETLMRDKTTIIVSHSKKCRLVVDEIINVEEN